MRTIFLIMIGLISLLSADFTRDSATDIVTDNERDLMWQDDADARSIQKTWSEAINYCENLTLGSYSDWRLPNINELKSIVDKDKDTLSIVDGFRNISTNDYRSSTTYAGYEGNAWYVSFYGGRIFNSNKYGEYYVRCVRDVD